MKNSAFLVSICCLTFNHKTTIEKAINSFLMQKTNFPVEIFIHDDASNDGTTEIIRKYHRENPEKIRLLIQPKNLFGKGTSLYEIYTKIVFAQAKGKYLAICEGDDYWTDPTKLQKQVDFLEQNQDFSLCFHRVGFVGNANVNFNEHHDYYGSFFKNRKTFSIEDLIKENFIPNCSVVYRNYGMEFPDLFKSIAYPDWPIHLIFAQKGKIHFIDEVMAHHRIAVTGIWEGKTLDERHRMNVMFYLNLIRWVDETYYPAIFDAVEKQKNYNPGLKYYDFFKLGLALGLQKNQHKTDDLQTTLDLIFNSKSWKITDSLRNLYHAFFPDNSMLRKTSNMVVQGIANSLVWSVSILAKSAKLVENAVRILHRKKVINQKWPSELPLVSVVIPNYNYGKYISEAIQSVLSQTFTNFEIIIVDGGSDDGETIEILKKINHPKIQVHFREGRHLVGDNRNFGINLAKGKYICCLDADDLIQPTYLEKAVFYLEAFNYDVVYPWVQSFGRDQTLWKTAPANFSILTEHCNVVATNAIFRKSAWQQTGGYRDYPIGKGHVSEDWEFWARMAGNGFRFQVITEPLLFYRKHWNSLADVSETSFEEQRLIICEENKALQSKENQRKRELLLDLTFRVKNPFENVKQKKQRMTILVALPFMIVGGVDTLFLNIFGHLSKSFNILFFTTMYFDDEFGDNTNRFRAISPHIYHLHRFLHNDEQRKLFIKYLVTCYKPDAMLIAGSEFTYHMLPDLRKANPAMKVIDALFNEEGHMENNRRYAKYIDLNIVENEKICEVLQQKFGESSAKIRLIPNGISLDLINKKLQAQEARNKLGIPDDKFIVTFLGRFSEEKNPAAVVEFAKRIPNQNIFFLMAGKGPIYDEIKKRIWQENLNEIILTPGFLNTIDVLSATDVLILPSTLDGRPNTVLEAMAMGVPVIASKVGGLPSLIEDGKNGFLIHPEATDEFVEKILRLKNNSSLQTEMAAAARKHAENFLDDKIMHKKYDEAVSSLLNNTAP